MLVRVFPLAFYHFSYAPIAHFLWYVEIPDPTLLKPLFPATRGGKRIRMRGVPRDAETDTGR